VAAPVELLGVEQTQAILDAVGEDIAQYGKPARAGAMLVQRTAASYGPHRTGDLGRSYRALGGKRQARVISRIVYGAVIEYGWPARNIGAQRRLQRAAEANALQIAALFEDHARAAIAKRNAGG
jgi:O6-methylguanine-DNA--protein-cysteine methyltransferase